MTNHLSFPARIRLLAIDDNEAVLDTLKLELEDTYDVLSASHPAKAFEIIKQIEIHIVLCDERLPGENGTAVLARLRKEFPNVVRILISGYTDTTVFLAAINQANVFKYVTKPFGPGIKNIIDEAAEFYLAQLRNQFSDVLTRLKSPHAILDALHKEIKRFNRYRTPLTAVLLEVTSPRKDSSLHNFLVDRLLLSRIAELLQAEIRTSDDVGRLRDNRFLILLTETGTEGSRVFLKRLLHTIDRFDQEVNRGLLPFEVRTAMLELQQNAEMTDEQILLQLYDQLQIKNVI
jgi:PleD family two-component response regulator